MVEVTEADREAAAKAPMIFISAGGKTAYDAICKILATHRIEAARAERDRLRELAKDKGFLSVEDIEQALDSQP